MLETMKDLRDLQKAGNVFDFTNIPNISWEEFKLLDKEIQNFLRDYNGLTKTISDFKDKHPEVFK
jgi:hypothetical protein